LGVVLLVLSIRNQLVIGRFDPVGPPRWVLVNDTGKLWEDGVYPDHGIERCLEGPESSLQFALRHPGRLMGKFARNLRLNLQAAFLATSPLLWGLFLAAVLAGILSPEQRRLAGFVAGAILITILAFSTGELEGDRFFVPFTPLLAAVAGAWFGQGKGEVSRAEAPVISRAWKLLLVLFIIYPGVFSLVEESIRVDPSERQKHFHAQVAFRRALADVVERVSKPGENVLSNTPWGAGWYGDRTAYWLPMTLEDLERLQERIPVQAVLLDGSVSGSREVSPEWGRLLSDAETVLDGFRRVDAAPGVFVRSAVPGGQAREP
jgi:hypothetical protein